MRNCSQRTSMWRAAEGSVRYITGCSSSSAASSACCSVISQGSACAVGSSDSSRANRSRRSVGLLRAARSSHSSACHAASFAGCGEASSSTGSMSGRRLQRQRPLARPVLEEAQTVLAVRIAHHGPAQAEQEVLDPLRHAVDLDAPRALRQRHRQTVLDDAGVRGQRDGPVEGLHRRGAVRFDPGEQHQGGEREPGVRNARSVARHGAWLLPRHPAQQPDGQLPVAEARGDARAPPDDEPVPARPLDETHHRPLQPRGILAADLRDQEPGQRLVGIVAVVRHLVEGPQQRPGHPVFESRVVDEVAQRGQARLGGPHFTQCCRQLP